MMSAAPMRKWAAAAIAIGFMLAGTASAHSQDATLDRFRAECRAQYAYLRGPGQREIVVAHVRACVAAKLQAFAHAAAIAPTSSEKPVRLLETNAWLIGPNRGPAQAKGVIYFVAGFSPASPARDDFRLAPYFLKSLADDGWDVVRAKLPHDVAGALSSEYVGGAAQTIRRRVAELKAEGYKRVVAAGHSWGGWATLMAARDGLVADALLLSAPNTFGSRISAITGRPNPDYNLVVSEFGPALSTNKIPTVLILPNDTEWDPDPAARGEIAERYFSQANVPHLVIAKPPGFFGHYAGWLPFFDFAYGNCIESFIEKPISAPCRLPEIADNDFRSILSLKQIAEAETRRIVSVAPLQGKKFAVYTLNDVDNKHFDYIAENARATMESDKEFRESITFRDGTLCVGNTCSVLIRWSDDELLEFDPTSGALKGWWIADR